VDCAGNVRLVAEIKTQLDLVAVKSGALAGLSAASRLS
jgi:hypothetical protein